MERHHKYFDCADEVARRFTRPGQKVIYYLVSDSNNLISDALKKFPDRVVVSGLGKLPSDCCCDDDYFYQLDNPSLTRCLGIRHLDPTISRNPEVSLSLGDATTNSVIEAWTLAATDFKILTEQSGFGKVASMLKGKPGTTVRRIYLRCLSQSFADQLHLRSSDHNLS